MQIGEFIRETYYPDPDEEPETVPTPDEEPEPVAACAS